MPVDNDAPLFEENVGTIYNAKDLRRLFGHLVGTPGELRYNACKVVESSPPAMTVSILAGPFVVEATDTNPDEVYVIENVGDIVDFPAGGLDPAHATLDRIDGIFIQIVDQTHDGGLVDNDAAHPVFVYIAGTPSGSPSTPATPDNATLIARVHVDALATEVIDANIIDTRRAAPRSTDSFDDLTWSNRTTDGDLDSATVARNDWPQTCYATFDLLVNPNDSVAWDCSLEVWTGPNGTGTLLGSKAFKNDGGTNHRLGVHITCDPFEMADDADPVLLYLHANYSNATPTTGFTPSTLSENRCRVHKAVNWAAMRL